jgi:hypothetical protein
LYCVFSGANKDCTFDFRGVTQSYIQTTLFSTFDWQNTGTDTIYYDGSILCEKLLINNSTGPSVASGLGAGTSPTLSLTGVDNSFSVNLTTGSTPSVSSTIFTITFQQTYSYTPRVVFSPANSLSASLNSTSAVYVSSITSSGFILNSNSTALIPSTAYDWNFIVL